MQESVEQSASWLQLTHFSFSQTAPTPHVIFELSQLAQPKLTHNPLGQSMFCRHATHW